MKKVLANRLYLSALGVLLVLAVCVFYLFAAVLNQPLTSRPVELTVQLKSAGGLFDGSAVTYRGVKVGKVTGIELTEDGVEAQLRLSAGTEVPEDSVAVVRSLSPVGEQYLDFQPDRAGGPFLESGDTISAESTDIPMSLQSTVVAVNKVLRQIDERKLRTTLVELSQGLSGTGDELGRLIDDGQLLLEELDRIYPQSESLLRNSDVALDIAPDKAADLSRLGTSAKQLAAFLRDYDPELRDTLRKAPGQIEQLEALVADARKVLPDFLSAGVSITDIFASYEPHVRRLLQTYAPGLGVLTRAITGNELRIQLILDADRRCAYDVPRLDPSEPGRRPLQQNGNCAASFSTLQRGAAHAPGPVR
ncbi:MAG TPA: MlaD family protein [Nocardioides sp.]|nr:MlaD family protein [Nocardioides sp.]